MESELDREIRILQERVARFEQKGSHDTCHHQTLGRLRALKARQEEPEPEEVEPEPEPEEEFLLEGDDDHAE